MLEPLQLSLHLWQLSLTAHCHRVSAISWLVELASDDVLTILNKVLLMKARSLLTPIDLGCGVWTKLVYARVSLFAVSAEGSDGLCGHSVGPRDTFHTWR